MVNIKSLFAILSVFSLLFVLLGLVRFGVDLWSYYHASGASSAHLDFRGVQLMLTGLILSAVFFVLFWIRKY